MNYIFSYSYKQYEWSPEEVKTITADLFPKLEAAFLEFQEAKKNGTPLPKPIQVGTYAQYREDCDDIYIVDFENKTVKRSYGSVCRLIISQVVDY